MGIAHKVQKNMSESLADTTYTSLIEAITVCHQSDKLPLIDPDNTGPASVKFKCDDTAFDHDVQGYLDKAFVFAKTKKLYKYLQDPVAMDNFCMITSGIVGTSYRFNTLFNADATGGDDDSVKTACFDVNGGSGDFDNVVNTQENSKFKVSGGILDFQDTTPVASAESHMVWYREDKNMVAIFGDGSKTDTYNALASICATKGDFELVETHFIGTDNGDTTYTAIIDTSDSCNNYNPSSDPYCYVGWSCVEYLNFKSLYEAIDGCSPMGPEIAADNTSLTSISFKCSTFDITTDDTKYDDYLTEAFKQDNLDALKLYMDQDMATMDNFCILTSALVGKKYRYDMTNMNCNELDPSTSTIHHYPNTGAGMEGITLFNFFKVLDIERNPSDDSDDTKFYFFGVPEFGEPYIFHDVVWFFYENDNMKAIHGEDILKTGELDDILDILPCDGAGEEFVEAVYYGELIQDNFLDLLKVTKLEDGDSTTCTGYNPKGQDENSHYCYKRYECMVPPTKTPTTSDPESTTSSSLSIVSSCLMILSLSALFL